jgi:hypothetical protein
LGRERGGDLNGGATEAGVELIQRLQEGAGPGVNDFGRGSEQVELGLAGGFEAVGGDAKPGEAAELRAPGPRAPT